MSHTYSSLLMHVIFSAKDRRACVKAELKDDLHAYIGGIIRELKGRARIGGGTNDHVHVLMKLPATCSAAEMVRVIKTNSSKWIHERWPAHLGFAWQTGYGAFTVSESRVAAVTKYIATQEQHHRKTSFRDEFLEFLRKNGMTYEERYVWE